MAPCLERVDALVEKTHALATLRRKSNADKTVGIVLFGFPPNAGAVGTAAYLSVFESLHNTLHRMQAEGYDVTPPATVDALRDAVLNGNAQVHGQEANVAATVTADKIVANTPWLDEIEATWGAAPGRVQSNGREVFILGAQFGKVMVGVQPTFGYEGDPMRLLFEKGFAPTHAFSAFYQYLKHDLKVDVLLHFGMHGALEFMPGKQNGLGGNDWPERLIGNMPNVYLYAANNPSEATLAKRRSNAVTITHLTPPLQNAGLYRGLADLKDSITRWRSDPARDPDLADLIATQAALVDLDATDIERALHAGEFRSEIVALFKPGGEGLGNSPDNDVEIECILAPFEIGDINDADASLNAKPFQVVDIGSDNTLETSLEEQELDLQRGAGRVRQHAVLDPIPCLFEQPAGFPEA